MRRVYVLLMSVGLSILSGCGYQLAGKADLDPVFESTHISYQAGGHTMALLLEKQFEANKYKLVSAEKATALVDVTYEKRDREILSVDEDGKVREYELILTVGIDVKDAEGKKLIRNQQVRLTRDFLFDINSLLGKSSEENQIYEEMRADAARLIIYRLQAINLEAIEEE